MNQEYVLLGGLYWRLARIPVFLWRNHPKGSLKTRIAVLLSNKVFCTSTQSFTAGFKKTKIMPVGYDTNIFKPVSGIVRKKYSVLMLGRISPVKHIELALSAFELLVKSGVQVSLNIVGSPPATDMDYYKSLKEYVTEHNLSPNISFEDEVSKTKAPEIFSSHEICLNLTESGSFDKTIVEATACGDIPIVTNTSLSGLLPDVCIAESRPASVAEAIKHFLDPHQRLEIQKTLETFVKSQGLPTLMEKLFVEFELQNSS